MTTKRERVLTVVASVMSYGPLLSVALVVWYCSRGKGEVAALRACVGGVCVLVAMLWADVVSLKARVRELEDPSLERWVRERVAKNREAGRR